MNRKEIDAAIEAANIKWNEDINKIKKFLPKLISRKKYEELKLIENNFAELLIKNKPTLSNRDFQMVIQNKHINFREEPILVNCTLIDCEIKNRSSNGLNIHGTHSLINKCVFTSHPRYKVGKK